MTPKIIELKQAPVVLVCLPENGYLEGYTDNTVTLRIDHDKPDTVGIAIPEGYWLNLGILSFFAEDQFAGCVTKSIHTGLFRHYVEGVISYSKASDSFYSLLESEKVYTENPVKVHTWASENADEYTKKWHEAQSRTIDPARTVVLLRKEGCDEHV